MTELLSYEQIMIIVDEYEGNDIRSKDDFDFEYYLDIGEDSYSETHWVEMSHYRFENCSKWELEKTEWDEFLEEL